MSAIFSCPDVSMSHVIFVAMGESDAPSRRYLPLWVGITEVLGIVLVVVTTHWLVVYYKGLNWGPQIFNNHPFYMVLGLVFVYGNGKPRSF